MTGAAWLMLIVTWSIIVSFTGYYFWKVLVTPPHTDAGDEP
jgi:hypothetical protein